MSLRLESVTHVDRKDSQTKDGPDRSRAKYASGIFLHLGACTSIYCDFGAFSFNIRG